MAVDTSMKQGIDRSPLFIALLFIALIAALEGTGDWVYNSFINASALVTKGFIVDNFVDNVWQKFYTDHDILTRSRSSEHAREFREHVNGFFSNYEMLSMSLYNTAGEVIASESEDSSAQFAQNEAMTGIFPLIGKLKAAIATQVGARTFISTIVPLYDNGSNMPNGTTNIVALLTLTYDYSMLASTIKKVHIMLKISVITIFITAIIVMMHHAKKTREPLVAHQAELRDTLAAAKHDNQSKSIFFANFSHELCTPLNAIIGFSDVMQRDVSLSKQNAEYVQYIHESGKHLLEIINDILDYFRLEAHYIEIDPAQVDAAEVTKLCVNMINKQAEAKHIKILSYYEQAIIMADNKRLRQVILNVLSNAIKFTRENGAIAISVTNDGKIASIQVEDNGIGIAPDDMTKILIPFYRASNNNNAPGVGLGLAITQELVRLMNGKFEIRSMLEKGTTVELLFGAENIERTQN